MMLDLGLAPGESHMAQVLIFIMIYKIEQQTSVCFYEDD